MKKGTCFFFCETSTIGPQLYTHFFTVFQIEKGGNDSKKAEKMWNATKKWRIKENIWSIHAFKHNCYEAMKDAYRHHFHGVSKEGYPTTFEQPGTMRVKEFFRAGYSVDDAVSTSFPIESK